MTSSTAPAFRRYTNLAAAMHLLQERRITLLNPARWDDANDSYFMAEYKRLAGAKTVLKTLRSIRGCSNMSIVRSTLIGNDEWKGLTAKAVA